MSKDQEEEKLKAIYLDPKNPASFTGAANLYKAARAAGLKLSLKDVKEFLKSVDAYTLHKRVNRRFQRNPIYVTSRFVQWSMDLVEFQTLASENSGYRYILIAIDVLSRYAWFRPLKNKKPQTVVEALKDIFAEGRKPLRIRTDRGTEFLGGKMQDFLKSQGIVHMLAGSENKSCLAERLAQTLKGRIYRYLTHTGASEWVDKLQDFARGYNNTVHRTLKMRPADVNDETEGRAFFNLYVIPALKNDDCRPTPQNIRVGQLVRVSLEKERFQRSFKPKWSGEVFKVIEKISQTPNVLYKVADFYGEPVYGLFYPQELQVIRVDPDKPYKIDRVLKTRTRRGVKEYFVSWQNWPPRYNSWVQNLESVS